MDASWLEARRCWIEELAASWEWAINFGGHDPANVRGQVDSRISQLRSEAAAYRQTGQPPEGLLEAINRLLQDGHAPVHPRSERGQLIATIRRVAGDEAAIFGFPVLSGVMQPNNATTAAQLRGATLAVSPEIMQLVDHTANVQAERAKFRKALQVVQDEAAAAADERERDWKAGLKSALGAARSSHFRRARKFTGYANASRLEEQAAINSIKAVEAAYKEHMGLAAPVKYWKDKAKQHAKAEFFARLWVIVFFPVALTGMAAAFIITGQHLLASVEAIQKAGVVRFPTEIFIVASAGLASCAGLVFWVGRLLTKLYLSQHHLRQDSDERATMTETYLALIENGAASAEERQIILNALFRNTPDGIVKEDGGLDPSIAAALGKFLAKT